MKKIVVIFVCIIFIKQVSIAQNLSFSGGYAHSVMLCKDGSVYCMGNNGNGQLGTGALPATSTIPVQVLRGAQASDPLINDGTHLGTIRMVDAGSGNHTLALACDGTVFSWGESNYGQLGDNTFVGKNTPVKVLGGLQGGAFLQGATIISGGNACSYAVVSNGEVMSWGKNSTGDLGDGTATNRSTPVYVKVNATTRLTGIVQIEGGDAFAVALKSDGTVWAWGDNANGQLGQGNNTDLFYATQIFKDAGRTIPLTNIVKISAGDQHVMALTSTGTIFAWGGTWSGQLGVPGGSVLFPSPVLTSATGTILTGVASISAGNQHSIAAMIDGTVMTWGATANYKGQTGTGAGTTYPTTVPGLATISEVSDGDYWTFASDASGNVYSFGNNSSGELGVGSGAATVTVPTLISLPCPIFTTPCPDVFLGADITLCNPPTAYLNAPSKSTYSYRWKKDGVLLPETSDSLLVSSPGTYRAIVWDSTFMNGCGYCAPDSDDVVVTSSNPIVANNSTFCTSTCEAVNLSVTGPGGTNYDWYSSQYGGVPLNGVPSNTFTTPCISSSTTYWVQDPDAQRCVGGYLVDEAPLSGSNTAFSSGAILAVSFDVLTSFTLDSVTIKYTKSTFGVCANGASDAYGMLKILIKDGGGVVLATINPLLPCGSGTATVQVPIGYTFAIGTNYSLQFDNTAQGTQVTYFENGAVYPRTDCSWIKFNSSGTAADPDDWGAFFDWRMRVGTNSCGRVAVQAVKDLPANCNPCTAVTPSSASADFDTFCQGVTTQLTLSIVGGSGDNLVWYSGSCGGTMVGSSSTGAPVVISAPSTTTTYYARWESTGGGGCSSSCVSVATTPVLPPSTSVAGSNQNLCNANSISLAADAPLSGSGLWTIVGGSGTIADPSSPTSLVSDIAEGDLVLKWTISQSPCPSSSAQVTIHRDTLSTPVIDGSGAAAFDSCAFTTGIPFSTTINHAPVTTYSWTTTGTLSVSGQTNNSATIDVGASGGTLIVTETNGACVLSTSKLISVSPTISTPYAGPDKAICSGSLVTLEADLPTVGNGKWSSTNGTTFSSPFSPTSNALSLSNGSNILTWTITGCGGPLSDEVNIIVGAANSVLVANGPSDTMCIGFPRELKAEVTGGSGDFSYIWTSSDNSFTQTTTSQTVTVEPMSNTVQYFVYASDNINIGCISNIGTITIHAVPSQEFIIYNLITSNNDGMNDKFIGKDAITLKEPLPNSKLEVFNIWGSRVFLSENYDNSWGGEGLSEGVYYYYLIAGCGEKVHSGWVQITK